MDEGISALMDGELEDAQAQRELTRLKNEPESRERWESFHVIGDAMRGERPMSPGFSTALAQRLAAEPTVLAPRRSVRPSKRLTTYALSAAASVAAVTFVGWVALAPTAPVGLQAGVTPAPALVAAPVTAPVGASLTNVSSEGHMNEYLLAHQGFSPSTAIQGLAPYIRSVSATRAPAAR